jgi:hypothetical protein
LSSFDPATFSLQGRIPVGGIRRPDILPTEGWMHVAMVVAPDGQVRLLLNGEEATQGPVPLAMHPDFRWRVELLGRAADTRLLVRDLVLWEGMRY